MYPYLHIGGMAISTYFLVISAASTAGALWFLRRNQAHGLSQLAAIDYTLVALVAGFAGARLLHVFYEEPAYYLATPLHAVEIWNGGFVFLGGVLGAALGTYLYCWRKKLPFLMMTDLAVIPMSFAYAVGRVACFLNGCCYGKVCVLPWAITLNGEPRHPTQLYATFWEAVVLLVLLKAEPRLKTPGQLFGLWLVLHAPGRMLMEFFRDDPRGGMIGGLSLATWMSVAMICLGAGLLMAHPRGGPEVANSTS